MWTTMAEKGHYQTLHFKKKKEPNFTLKNLGIELHFKNLGNELHFKNLGIELHFKNFGFELYFLKIWDRTSV